MQLSREQAEVILRRSFLQAARGLAVASGWSSPSEKERLELLDREDPGARRPFAELDSAQRLSRLVDLAWLAASDGAVSSAEHTELRRLGAAFQLPKDQIDSLCEAARTLALGHDEPTWTLPPPAVRRAPFAAWFESALQRIGTVRWSNERAAPWPSPKLTRLVRSKPVAAGRWGDVAGAAARRDLVLERLSPRRKLALYALALTLAPGLVAVGAGIVLDGASLAKIDTIRVVYGAIFAAGAIICLVQVLRARREERVEVGWLDQSLRGVLGKLAAVMDPECELELFAEPGAWAMRSTIRGQSVRICAQLEQGPSKPRSFEQRPRPGQVWIQLGGATDRPVSAAAGLDLVSSSADELATLRANTTAFDGTNLLCEAIGEVLQRRFAPGSDIHLPSPVRAVEVTLGGQQVSIDELAPAVSVQALSLMAEPAVPTYVSSVLGFVQRCSWRLTLPMVLPVFAVVMTHAADGDDWPFLFYPPLALLFANILIVLPYECGPLPYLAPRRVWEEARAKLVLRSGSLCWEGSEEAIALSSPFGVSLTVSEPGPQGQALLGVELSQRGAGRDRRVRMRVPVVTGREAQARLSAYDLRAPILPAGPFAEVVWPLIAHHAAAHGGRLDWGVTLAQPAPE